VVDHQVHRLERVDARRIAAHGAHGVPHRGEVDDRGDAREVLEEHPRRHEGDLVLGDALRVPGEQRLDVLAADAQAVLEAEQVLEQDLQRDREPGGPLTEHVQAVDDEARARNHELATRAEGVGSCCHARTIYGPGRWFHGPQGPFGWGLRREPADGRKEK
jgi:hypothetical protein